MNSIREPPVTKILMDSVGPVGRIVRECDVRNRKLVSFNSKKVILRNSSYSRGARCKDQRLHSDFISHQNDICELTAEKVNLELASNTSTTGAAIKAATENEFTDPMNFICKSSTSEQAQSFSPSDDDIKEEQQMVEPGRNGDKLIEQEVHILQLYNSCSCSWAEGHICKLCTVENILVQASIGVKEAREEMLRIHKANKEELACARKNYEDSLRDLRETHDQALQTVNLRLYIATSALENEIESRKTKDN